MGYDHSPCLVEGPQDAGLSQARRALPEGVRLWEDSNSVLTLGSIYVSDVGVVVCLDEADMPETSAELSPAVSKSLGLKETVGRLMRMVIGYTEQVGLFVPVYCVVCGPKDSHIVREMGKAAADQDWHRGDFAIVAIEAVRDEGPRASAEKEIADLILDVPYKAFMARLEPVSKETLLRRIDEEMGARVLSDKRIELLRVIKAAIKDDRDLESEVRQWVEDRINDAAPQREESD